MKRCDRCGHVGPAEDFEPLNPSANNRDMKWQHVCADSRPGPASAAYHPRRDGPIPRPYPIQPLIDITGCQSIQEWSDRFGARGHTLIDMTCGLSELAADRWAVRCGYHPAEVWPDLWVPEAHRMFSTL